jgi:hypothetical protein
MTLELALTRWSVVCRQWNELSSGYAPYLPAFLCGWTSRQIGLETPDVSRNGYASSFRIGWKEADEQIEILSSR